jgi:hypothetical protein
MVEFRCTATEFLLRHVLCACGEEELIAEMLASRKPSVTQAGKFDLRSSPPLLAAFALSAPTLAPR